MRRRYRRRLLTRLFSCCAFGVVAGPGGAPAQVISVSPDTSIDLDGTVVEDEHVATDTGVGPVLTQDLGAIPGEAAVSAFHLESGGDRLFVLETTVELPGALIAEPRDVVRYDGATYALEFDGSAQGIPSGTAIDAFSLDEATGDHVLSFDGTVDLGGGLVADDEDLVLFDGGSFSLVFDGSAEGVDPGLDIDGAHFREDTNDLLVSFDGSGMLGGVNFDDEDVLLFESLSGSWSMLYDASVKHAEWEPSDLDAVHYVPEPSAFLMLAAGTAFLVTIGRCRTRQGSSSREVDPAGGFDRWRRH